MKWRYALFAMVFFIFTISVAGAENLLFTPVEVSKLAKKLQALGFKNDQAERIILDKRLGVQIFEKPACFSYFGLCFGLFSAESVRRGKRVLTENGVFLMKLSERYSVEKEFVVSIFRMESDLGDFLGSYGVFNTLATLWLSFGQKRAEHELGNFVLWCRNNLRDPFSIVGSRCGAFGFFQFMPFNHLYFSKDGDGDHRVDPFNFADGAASAVYLLQLNGWRKNKKRALWLYNHSDEYVKAIEEYANAIK